MMKTLKKIKKVLTKKNLEFLDVKVSDLINEPFFEIICEEKKDLKILTKAICKEFDTAPKKVYFEHTLSDGPDVQIFVSFEDVKNIGLSLDIFSNDLLAEYIGIDISSWEY